ncbi:MAG: cobalamin-binding protein [Pirellulaceae bacterium]
MMALRPRIVSLLSSATEILYALDLQDHLAGISHECDYPPAALQKPQVTVSHIDASLPSHQIDEQVRSNLKMRRSLYGLDSDLLSELTPDLIITQAQCEVCAIHYDEVLELVAATETLAETKILALQPRCWKDVFQDIISLGTAVDCRDKAVQLVEALQGRIDRIAGILERNRVQRPRVVCIEWIEPLMVAGNWVSTLVELAGGINGVSAADVPSQYETWSDVLAFDPEVIVVCPCGFDLHRTRQELPQLQQVAGWQEMSAVKNQRVFVLDGNSHVNRSGPRLVETVEILAHLFHPDQVPAPQLPQPAAETWYHWIESAR